MALNVKNLEGNEIAADDYVRKPAERGRWGDTWDVFKSNFGKIVLINIFILITFLPGVAIIFIRNIWINAQGTLESFNANTGFGYPAGGAIAGKAELIHLNADLIFIGALVLAGFIASLGISGGAYSIKKLLNTHGEFSVKGFFHGIKVCYLNVAVPVTVFMLFYYGSVLIGDWKDVMIAGGASRHGPLTAYAFMLIATILVGLYCAWLIATGVSYKVKFVQLVKNSFVLLIGSPIQTIFFAGFALIPVWLFLLGGLIRTISYVVFIFLGFSFILLVWMSFTQYVFDLYITPNLKAAKEAEQAAKTPKQLALEKEEEDKRQALELLAAGKSELIGRPILPIDQTAPAQKLGKTFSRADISGVGDQRVKLSSDIQAYAEEHKNDRVYAEYNKLFAERERALKEGEGKKKNKKNKKISSDNLLK